MTNRKIFCKSGPWSTCTSHFKPHRTHSTDAACCYKRRSFHAVCLCLQGTRVSSANADGPIDAVWGSRLALAQGPRGRRGCRLLQPGNYDCAAAMRPRVKLLRPTTCSFSLRLKKNHAGSSQPLSLCPRYEQSNCVNDRERNRSMRELAITRNERNIQI